MKKLLLTAVAVVAGLLVAVYLVYRLLETGSTSPWALLALAALVSIALPMVRANFFPSARECAVEYDFHEKRLEEHIRRQIAEAFGQQAVERIYTPVGQFSDSAARRLEQLLENPRTRKDADLRFALLMALARVFEQSDDLPASIAQLIRALETRPRHFMASFRLALQYEQIGRKDNALVHYRQALEDPGGISRGMKRLTAAQIKRLQATEP